MELSSRDCEQARFWASLGLDGELSELETAALDEHLQSCGSCRSFVANLTSTASMLRGAPLVEPPPLARPALRRVRVRPSLIAVAAIVAIAAGAGSLLGTLSSSGPGQQQRAGAAAQRPFIAQQLLALA